MCSVYAKSKVAVILSNFPVYWKQIIRKEQKTESNEQLSTRNKQTCTYPHKHNIPVRIIENRSINTKMTTTTTTTATTATTAAVTTVAGLGTTRATATSQH